MSPSPTRFIGVGHRIVVVSERRARLWTRKSRCARWPLQPRGRARLQCSERDATTAARSVRLPELRTCRALSRGFNSRSIGLSPLLAISSTEPQHALRRRRRRSADVDWRCVHSATRTPVALLGDLVCRVSCCDRQSTGSTASLRRRSARSSPIALRCEPVSPSRCWPARPSARSQRPSWASRIRASLSARACAWATVLTSQRLGVVSWPAARQGRTLDHDARRIGHVHRRNPGSAALRRGRTGRRDVHGVHRRRTDAGVQRGGGQHDGECRARRLRSPRHQRGPAQSHDRLHPRRHACESYIRVGPHPHHSQRHVRHRCAVRADTTASLHPRWPLRAHRLTLRSPRRA